MSIKKNKGFTLIELLVVIAIISLLSSVVLASLNSARMKARDAKRLSDMHQIKLALNLYYSQNGRYPSAASDAIPYCGDWDTTADGTFIPALVTSGFLSSNISDPSINTDCMNYRYYRYDINYEGCTQAPFYVLGVTNMETSPGKHPSSLGWKCPNRNWEVSDSLEWVAGEYE